VAIFNHFFHYRCFPGITRKNGEKREDSSFVENRFWLKTCPPDTKEKILRTLCERERYRPLRRVLSGFPCQIGEVQSGLVWEYQKSLLTVLCSAWKTQVFCLLTLLFSGFCVRSRWGKGKSEPATTRAPWWVERKWSRNTFLLGSSFLGREPWPG
jgi:hypothetical protein